MKVDGEDFNIRIEYGQLHLYYGEKWLMELPKWIWEII